MLCSPRTVSSGSLSFSRPGVFQRGVQGYCHTQVSPGMPADAPLLCGMPEEIQNSLPRGLWTWGLGFGVASASWFLCLHVLSVLHRFKLGGDTLLSCRATSRQTFGSWAGLGHAAPTLGPLCVHLVLPLPSPIYSGLLSSPALRLRPNHRGAQ